MAATEAEKPFITCHVLDTSIGKPAANVDVQLRLLSPDIQQNTIWTGTTNADGRVTAWHAEGHDLNEVVASIKNDSQHSKAMQWSLLFLTEPYFGDRKTFFNVVDIKFIAEQDQAHYHVPLLLSPWSYSTYRGS